MFCSDPCRRHPPHTAAKSRRRRRVPNTQMCRRGLPRRDGGPGPVRRRSQNRSAQRRHGKQAFFAQPPAVRRARAPYMHLLQTPEAASILSGFPSVCKWFSRTQTHSGNTANIFPPSEAPVGRKGMRETSAYTKRTLPGTGGCEHTEWGRSRIRRRPDRAERPFAQKPSRNKRGLFAQTHKKHYKVLVNFLPQKTLKLFEYCAISKISNKSKFY
jgi:hypothetical protein